MTIETETLDLITKGILAGLIGGGFTGMGFLLKGLFKSTRESYDNKFDSVVASINELTTHQKASNGTVKELVEREQACKDSLPKTYVTTERFLERKADTSQMFKDLFGIAAEIREKLSFLLGSLSPDAIRRAFLDAEKKKSNGEVK